MCEAVCQFSAGIGSVIELLSSLGSELSGNTYWSLRQEDKRRLHEAARKISLKARLIRRKNRAKKKAANESIKCVYFAGGFGVRKTPDLDFAVASKILKGQKRHVAMKQQKTDEKISIKFMDEKNVAHILVT